MSLLLRSALFSKAGQSSLVCLVLFFSDLHVVWHWTCRISCRSQKTFLPSSSFMPSGLLNHKVLHQTRINTRCTHNTHFPYSPNPILTHNKTYQQLYHTAINFQQLNHTGRNLLKQTNSRERKCCGSISIFYLRKGQSVAGGHANFSSGGQLMVWHRCTFRSVTSWKTEWVYECTGVLWCLTKKGWEQASTFYWI